MSDSLKIRYNFDFNDGHKFSYEMKFDGKTMDLVTAPKGSYPDWTKLDSNQCSHCPLKLAETPRCPVAVNIADLTDQFKDKRSHGEAMVSVFTLERIYMKKLTVQESIQSIFGLLMATSGCPHLTFLRPMARFHLPFSTLEETFVRSLSLYLLKQFFVHKKGGKFDMDFSGLEQSYENLRILNRDFIERIRNLGKGDADANGLIILDSFAGVLAGEFKTGLQDVEALVNLGHL
jgi:hypothetical protein